MSATLDHTVLPPADSAPELSAVVAVLASGRATMVTADGATVELPTEVVEVMREVVQAMAEGRAVAIAPTNTMLTTQQAAELLGISRPTLVRLLEAGEIEYSQPGRHRRVALADLIAYQSRVRDERRRTLEASSAESGEVDAYRRFNGIIPTR